MALEGLKEQLKDKWADFSSTVLESSAFNNVREKFEEQSRTVQRAIIVGTSIFIALLLIYIPWGYIADSQEHMAEFAENRSMIQGLLRASRSAKEAAPLPPPMPVDALKGRIEAVLRDNRMIPDQIGEMQPLPGRPAKDLVPAVVIQTGLAVQIKKLNLEQITNLSHQIQNLGGGVKLMGLDLIQTAGQTHYYDIVAHVVAFALPPATSIEAEGPADKNSKRKRPARKSGAEETGE